MKFCSGNEISAMTEKLISEKHQAHKYSVDLTVSKVLAVNKGGDLDFGGSEEKKALTEELKPEKRTPEDKYGWWTLTAGEYIVRFNEKIKIPENRLCILQPLPRTMKAGAIHSVQVFLSGENIEEVVLLVGKSGLNIKENARISSLMCMEAISG
ncbi:MAG: dCTP deaminase [Candidatus Omnitrophota bacterium]